MEKQKITEVHKNCSHERLEYYPDPAKTSFGDSSYTKCLDCKIICTGYADKEVLPELILDKLSHSNECDLCVEQHVHKYHKLKLCNKCYEEVVSGELGIVVANAEYDIGN